ncbi:hypothetical protein QTN47_18280 [Danxiaibacter flavus]|uniref:Right-handed parallel beta-helix repeat-containing protein n=1 Tax=Danxiaibacter flavus TaxID=3049108 RepID=A0ABV3ZK33_9BACT|nr:hypothetical protein QNM32_18290 [Chitinophagaceae bacterium DXS]
MIKTIVGLLLCGTMLLISCSKSNDVVAPTSPTEREETETENTPPQFTGKKINLPLNGSSVYIKDAGAISYEPGDTLVIPQSVMRVALYNVNGTKEKPVIVTAERDVVIGGHDRTSFDIKGSFVKVVNINIKGAPTAIGIRAYYCSDIAFQNVNVDGAAIGFMLKNDAMADNPDSYYPKAVIKNISIANISVKNCTNEGYYIGNTSDYQNGFKNSPIIGLTVKNCRAENTGWDGFQVTNAQDCNVDGITVINAGTENKESQMSGIAIQDATTGRFKNLSVNKSTGAGLTLFSNGDTHVSNVALQDVSLSAKSYGIIVDNRYDRGFNLPPKKLLLENASVKQTTSVKGKNALYVINGTNNGAKAAIPGTVTNFTYDRESWQKKTVDYAKNAYIGGTDGR